ncbi:MAG TPA: hypothetical protein VHC21_03065 [Candidatus Saccharimonadales bacterium]|nr:hypothetical protein [Candidatus Saccharimonadales bacterium]
MSSPENPSMPPDEASDESIIIISEEQLEAARNNPDAQKFLKFALDQERYLEENGLILR